MTNVRPKLMGTNAAPTAYDELVAAIMKAVPGIRQRYRQKVKVSWAVAAKEAYIELPPDMTLEDILHTWYSTGDLVAKAGDSGRQGMIKIVEKWCMGRSLEWHREYAPETIELCHSLLCK